MKFSSSVVSILFAALGAQHAAGFSPSISRGVANYQSSALKVSVGLGPEAEAEEEGKVVVAKEEEEVEIVEPDHELFRDSRLSDFDRQCDTWYGSILKTDEPSFLGKVSEEALVRINTLPKLEREPVITDTDDKDWTPYTIAPLKSSPILPAYGLEQYGLPIPRRNAEAWRQYDVTGLVGTDYSGTPVGTGSDITLDDSQIETYTATLKEKGAWIDDEECDGRLVYINGRFAPSLSKTSDIAKNLSGDDIVDDEMMGYLNRLPDGFTDRLAADVPSGETDFLTSLKKLSGPNHNVGDPTKQFSINNQQGTAAFVALNSVRAGSFAYVNAPAEAETKPVIIVNAVTADGGAENGEDEKGVSMHPRTLAVAEENSKLAVIQSAVDLDDIDGDNSNPKFVNGATQIYVKGGAKVTHSYLEETGGIVTPGVEEALKEGVENQRDVEAKRKALKDTHFEMIDVHVTGDDGIYEGSIMGLGGNGRSRIAISTTLLRPGTHAGINGFTLSGGAQRTDMRTNIHHIAQGTTSKQAQKNMIGGRATNIFKGRIRVEQSAQQTDSDQLARTILMTDKARVWAIPSLEIIADDVQCTHGATVSDLSEEELFYLRSRGVDRSTARNILMFGFVDEISRGVDDSVQGHKDDPNSLKNRIIKRLQNMVPQGEKTLVGDEFQSV